jgi:CopG family nickel-responsive transcriptional regulator
VPIVAVSMPEKDLMALDKLQKSRGFSSRSDVIRRALRSFLEEYRNLETAEGWVTAVITILYGKKGKSAQCHQIQHEQSHLIEALLHAHSTKVECLDVMIVKGEAQEIQGLVRIFRAQRQIQQVTVNLLHQ